MKKKVILVTGAATEIGQYVVKQYAYKRTYDVIAIDETNPLPESNRIVFFPADLKDEMESSKVFRKIPKINLAINCCYIIKSTKPFLESTISDLSTIWRSAISASVNSLQQQLRIMKSKDEGKIINITSALQTLNPQSLTSEALVQASLTALTQTLATDYLNSNIKINAIVPVDYCKIVAGLRNINTVEISENVYLGIKMLEKNSLLNGHILKV